jgi:hypothetical protein
LPPTQSSSDWQSDFFKQVPAGTQTRFLQISLGLHWELEVHALPPSVPASSGEPAGPEQLNAVHVSAAAAAKAHAKSGL